MRPAASRGGANRAGRAAHLTMKYAPAVTPWCLRDAAEILGSSSADPAFRTKPQLAVELVDAALEAGVPCRAVVADCFYGENATFEGALDDAALPYVLA